ncbi:MAG: hypothetical protein ACAI35_09410 [Candidatus Methylacidiphilales bacterium]
MKIRLLTLRKICPVAVVTLAVFITHHPRLGNAQTTYTQTITGTPSDTAYSTTTDATGKHYKFQNNDSISVTNNSTQVAAVNVAAGAPKVWLDPGGAFTIGAIRSLVTPQVSGRAVGIYANSNTVTVGGPVTVNARDVNAQQQAAAVCLNANGQTAQIVINGNTKLNAVTDSSKNSGFAQVILTQNFGTITINGDVTADSRCHHTNYAINGKTGSFNVHGNLNLKAIGLWPSDNVNGIWNEDINRTFTYVSKNLDIYAESNGSTVMGIRNNGIIAVDGNTKIQAIGPRTSHGIASQHRFSRTLLKGDVNITASGGFNTFGDTVGIINNGYISTAGRMEIGGETQISAIASNNSVLGIRNTGKLTFFSTTKGIKITANATHTINVHNAYGIQCLGGVSGTIISNAGMDISATTVKGIAYGIFNTGSIVSPGPLKITVLPSQGGTTYALYAQEGDAADSKMTFNAAGGKDVAIDGKIATSSSATYKGILELKFDTARSYLNGLVTGTTTSGTYKVGKPSLEFKNGASWRPPGDGTISNDLGTGSLDLGPGSEVDMGAYWGKFSPGSIPTFAPRTMLVTSTKPATGATVTVGDGATFRITSDLLGYNGWATADEIDFGSGIKTLNASGTQKVAISYDPLFADIDSTTATAGTIIYAGTPITVVDISDVGNGLSTFDAVIGVEGKWKANDDPSVEFSYMPLVALSPDRRQIVLYGIAITK